MLTILIVTVIFPEHGLATLAAMKTSELRILFVVDAIQGRNGVGTYFQDLVAHLDERVAQVELVSPRLGQPHPCQGLSLPMPGDPTQRLFLPRMRWLTQQIMTMKPHVIVIPGPGIFSFAASWIAARLGIPVCVTHQTDYNSLVNLYWRGWFAGVARRALGWLNRWMFRRAASVATISEPMMNQLRELGIFSPHLVGTPLAPQFIQSPVTEPSGTISRILFVGRLAAEKNLDQFLALSKMRPDLQFSVVGDGPLRAMVERHVRQQSNLQFHGWCSRETVVKQVDQHDLLILPSAVEAFGTVALEAMARRRLVMVTPACGINDWPQLVGGLFVMQAQESPAMALQRLEQMPPILRRQMVLEGERAAREINEQCLGQWSQVLRIAARQAPNLPRPLPSPAFALLRRLAATAEI
ncbi:MAG: glycosyltransferase [Alcanivoracaceae bacterium]|nr:glycosyltransferase [Alcanivoracaceae bacterium]